MKIKTAKKIKKSGGRQEILLSTLKKSKKNLSGMERNANLVRTNAFKSIPWQMDSND